MLSSSRVYIASIALLAISALASVAHAAADTWNNTSGGNWEIGANWTDGSTPGISDAATFNLPQTYTVTLAVDPVVIQGLSATAGTVIFRSSGGARTLHLTAGAGSQDIVVSGATTTLSLGSASNPLHLNAGDDLSIRTGATLAVLFGSQISAFDLSDSGLNGTLRVDGAGSRLTLSGAIANLVGSTGAGSIIFQNNSTDNTIIGPLGLASSATAGTTGNLSVLSGSSLSLGGNLTLANQNVSGQTATVNINGTASSLTQSGGAPITVGSAINGTAIIAIGTTASGGTLTTGTGLFTINKTGTVLIGSGSNTGTLNLGGDLTINGGLLQVSSAESNLEISAGKTVTLQAGGRLSLARSMAVDSNQAFQVSGANSRLEVAGTNTLTIGDGAQVSIASGAALAAGGHLEIGNDAASIGTLSVAGSGSTAMGGNAVSAWGVNGGTALVSFGNGAIGSFTAGLDLANSSAAGTMALVDVLSGANLNIGNLNLATAGGTTTAATLNIQGASSGILLAAAATLIVGHANEGIAAINVGTTQNGGTLTTGGGLFRINKTGTVTIGDDQNGGTLEVLGNLTVDGGVLQENSNLSTFAWATGKTLTIQNGGRVKFASSYTSAANSQHFVSGANSKFDIAGAMQIRNAAQATVNSGGSIAASQFDIGGGGTGGTFTVDGAGSTATGGGGGSHWGSSGAATVTISNQASVTLDGALQLAESATTVVSVVSGAELAVGDLTLTNSGAAAPATLNILGIGSIVSLDNMKHLTVGHATNGTATINLNDGGTLEVGSGGSTTVNGTGTMNVVAGTANLRALSVVGGTINLNGGTLAFSTLNVSGGSIKFNSGRIEQTGNLAANDSLLTTLLGPTHELGLSRTIAAGSGTTNILAKLDLIGGRLEGNALSVTNAGPNATTLRIRNGGTAQIAGNATLAGGTFTFVEDGSSLVAGGQIVQASELQLSGTGRVAAATLANSGLATGSGRIDANLDNLSTGQLRIASDNRILLRGGNHQNNGLLDIDDGELEVVAGSFVNGTANPATATIAARNAALRFTEGLTNAGSIVCSGGTCNVFGSVTNVASQPTTGRIVITANSQATFFGDVVNRGTIQVSAAGAVESTALFLGGLTGNGVSGSGSVFLEGSVRPGDNIGTMAFGGDVSIGSAAILTMELAGGQFDRVTVQQSLSLSGKLKVVLAPGFLPMAGQSFDLIDWGTRLGSFAMITLPTLPGLSWNTSQLYTTGTLSLATATTPGDFNGDGTVNAADYTVWRNGLGSIYTENDYNVWKSHFGQSAGGGSAGATTVQGAVPEPAAILLALLVSISLIAILRTPSRRQHASVADITAMLTC